ASGTVTEKYKKVMVAPLAATTSIFKRPPGQKRNYVFMVISPAEVYLEGLLDTGVKRGLKTVAVVNEDTLFSKAAASGAEEVAKKKGLQEVFDSYKKEFNHEPSYHSAAGYAGCLIYAEGVKRANSLDADRVREQLLKLEMRTPFGDYKVDQDGFQVAHKMVTFQWQKEKKVIVWPEDLAKGKLLFP